MPSQPSEPTEFGHRLRKLRDEIGLSQVELAEEIQVKSAAISRLETSPNANPTLSTIRKLAAALGVKVCDLICDGHKHEG